jgi:hypothetical protein
MPEEINVTPDLDLIQALLKTDIKDKDKSWAAVSDNPDSYSPLMSSSLSNIRNNLLSNSSVYSQMGSADNYCNKYVIPQRLADWRASLWARGFSISHPHPVINQAYKKFAKKNKLSLIVLQGMKHLSRMNNACLVWRQKDNRGGIDYIQFHNPSQTRIDMIGDKLWINPTQEFKNLIMKATDKQLTAFKDRHGKGTSLNRWVDTIKKPPMNTDNPDFAGLIPLSKETGEHWIIMGGDGGNDEYNYAPCAMASIFTDIELIELLAEGDWATAFLLKNIIMLVKVGESITSGPLAGSTKNWAKGKDLTNIKTQIEKVGKAQIVYGNHTLTIEFIFPDPKVFSAEKYEAVIKRVCWFFGIGQYVIIGEGGNSYSSASWNIQAIRNEAKIKRTIMTEHLTEFLTDPSITREVFKGLSPFYYHNCFDKVDDITLTFSNKVTDARIGNIGDVEYSKDNWNTAVTLPVKDVFPDTNTVLLARGIPSDAKPEQFRLKLQSDDILRLIGPPEIKYDNRVLRDDKQVLSEITAMLQQGPLSNVEALQELGYEYEEQIANKSRDWENRKDLIPIFEKGAGILSTIVYGLQELGFEPNTKANKSKSTEEGGRPATGDVTNVDTNDQARPSTS